MKSNRFASMPARRFVMLAGLVVGYVCGTVGLAARIGLAQSPPPALFPAPAAGFINPPAGNQTHGNNPTSSATPRLRVAKQPSGMASTAQANWLTGELLPEERVAMAVYDHCNRSVVHINTRSPAVDAFSRLAVREGSGSGWVVDQRGTIVTNYHVIEGAGDLSVSLFNGLSYPATVVGSDRDTDIAVLAIDAPADELVPITWNNTQTLRVGQRIYAIGNPFGLERTMSVGMISSLNRQIPTQTRRSMRSLIQIDAALNQGNSGGPLLNTRGELIGMNTAIMSSDGDSAGVGFAIPVSTLQRIVPQLIRNGRVLRPTIGITRVYESDRGLLIVDVSPGGPADQAGLRGFQVITKMFRQGAYRMSIDPSTADLIEAVDGHPVQSADELLSRIEDKEPGEQVVLRIVRDKQSIDVPLRLGRAEE